LVSKFGGVRVTFCSGQASLKCMEQIHMRWSNYLIWRATLAALEQLPDLVSNFSGVGATFTFSEQV